MKYIIYKTREGEVPVLFSELVNHVNVGERLFGKKVSAGFVNIDAEATAKGEDIFVSCYGNSISMDLKSREEDEDLIREAVRFKL